MTFLLTAGWPCGEEVRGVKGQYKTELFSLAGDARCVRRGS